MGAGSTVTEISVNADSQVFTSVWLTQYDVGPFADDVSTDGSAIEVTPEASLYHDKLPVAVTLALKAAAVSFTQYTTLLVTGAVGVVFGEVVPSPAKLSHPSPLVVVTL